MQQTRGVLDAWGAYDPDEPFPLFASLAARGAVHHVTLADGHDAWVVLRFDEAMECLRDRRLSKDMRAALGRDEDIVAEGLPGPAFAQHMLNMDPPGHTRLRRLVSGAFSPRLVEGLRPRIQAIVDDLLDAVATRGPEGPADLVAELAFPLPFTVICELLGVPEPDQGALGASFVAMLVPTRTAEEFADAKAASNAVVTMLEALVAAKQDHLDDTLVSGLIRARDGDDVLTTRELLSTIFQLIVAGHDTTTSLIGNGVVALLRNPSQLETVRAHPDDMPGAIEEMLRYDAPVPHATFRYATEALDVGGTTIPDGAQVLICLAAANRDATRYHDPATFDVARGPARHLAFGHGVHHCLGAPLARMEADVAFRSLLRRFPHMRLAVPAHELHWAHGDGIVLRGLARLPVVPGPALSREG